MVILPWEKAMRALLTLSILLDSLNCNLNLAKKSAQVPKSLEVSAPTVLARKFSAQALAVLYLIHERTREILSESVWYLSNSAVKRRRHWRINFCDSILLSV